MKSLQKFRKMDNCEGQFKLNNYKQYMAIVRYSITSRSLVVYEVQGIDKFKSRDLDLAK